MTIDLAGLSLSAPIFNAAGTCKTLADVEQLCKSDAAAIMIGSITAEPRPGNAGRTYWACPRYALNAKGLPNPGYFYYREHLADMAQMAHDAGKFLFVSVAGGMVREYGGLATLAWDRGADLVELNLSCPSLPVPLDVSFEYILQSVTAGIGAQARVAVKVGPYLDITTIKYLAAMILQFPVVKAISAINTWPLALVLDDYGQPYLDTPGGIGALSGPALKPIGLGQVQQWRKILGPDFPIIGIGGIATAWDVKDYLAAGATATALATAFLEEGPGIFGEIIKELSA